MYDHIRLKATNFEKTRQFFIAALEPLGIRAEYDDVKNKTTGFGAKHAIGLWLIEGAPTQAVHIAFKSANRAAVNAFHAAALKAGGIDNGAPGLRKAYSPTYYAAFVFDPDGNNIEAVCHEPA